jgi:hypothetical protein
MAANTSAVVIPGLGVAWLRVTHWNPAGALVPSGLWMVRRAKNELRQGVAEQIPPSDATRSGEQRISKV